MAQIIEDGYGGNNDPQDNLTVLDRARIQGHNFADEYEDRIQMLIEDEGMSIHSMLKQAFQHGFLAGFAHRLSGGNDE